MSKEVPGYTDDDAAADVQAYLDEQASRGVMIAQAVTTVTVQNGALTVVFDPAKTGADQAALLDVQPDKNLARFAGVPLGWATKEAASIRSRVQRIETSTVDGTSTGTASAAEIYRLATGLDLWR
ncbi:hypothetical protein [Citricoccus nitrophenolicus]|uniref:hypothetical protein n=1 Tax=Citricoccus nitrophenolicus TaxID=863575 RepID=UPI0039B63E36